MLSRAVAQSSLECLSRGRVRPLIRTLAAHIRRVNRLSCVRTLLSCFRTQKRLELAVDFRRCCTVRCLSGASKSLQSHRISHQEQAHTYFPARHGSGTDGDDGRVKDANAKRHPETLRRWYESPHVNANFTPLALRTASGSFPRSSRRHTSPDCTGDSCPFRSRQWAAPSRARCGLMRPLLDE